MAFSGLHVTFSYAGGVGRGSGSIPIYGLIASSDDPASGVASTAAAPSSSLASGDPMASVYAAADSWLTVGPAPADPSLSTSTRRFIPAGRVVDFFCAPNDKIKWVAA